MTSDLYGDMAKLNALYEELCWDHDDELVFTHDGKRVMIYNETQEEGFRFNATSISIHSRLFIRFFF